MMIKSAINHKKYILSSWLSLLLVGCIDTNDYGKYSAPQPMPYNNTKDMAADEQYPATPQQKKTTKTSNGLDLTIKNNLPGRRTTACGIRWFGSAPIEKTTPQHKGDKS
ncbi:hypothetical protein ACEE86_14535, partial [Proteus mirabilis]